MDFLKKLNFQKHHKLIIGVCTALILLGAYFFIFSSPLKSLADKNTKLTIPAIGTLPHLSEAMQSNGQLKSRVKDILSYDEATLFQDYKNVNLIVSEIMFLWVGMKPSEIKNRNRKEMAEDFVRKVYNLPLDTPLENNPLLEKYPWANLFQKIKAKILMQGAGYKIYDGIAYYDSANDTMVVEGGLSSSYIQNLGTFINTLPDTEKKKYRNNYLMFIDETLGLKNLSAEEKEDLKKYNFF